MYNVADQSEYFYKYDMEKDRVFLIGDRNDLLWEIFQMLGKEEFYFAAKEQYGSHLNVTGNDTYCLYQEHVSQSNIYTTRKIYIRPYLFFDGCERNIDTRDLLDEAIRMYASFPRQREYPNAMDRYEKIYGKLPHGYRNGPVAMIRKRRGGPNASSKRRGIHRIQQMASDKEYGRYIRKKAIPKSVWSCEIFEETRRHESWKKQKKRRQWM